MYASRSNMQHGLHLALSCPDHCTQDSRTHSWPMSLTHPLQAFPLLHLNHRSSPLQQLLQFLLRRQLLLQLFLLLLMLLIVQMFPQLDHLSLTNILLGTLPPRVNHPHLVKWIQNPL